MTESKKVQLYTDRECTIEAFPETSAKYVTLSDGLDLESVLKHDLTAPTVTHEETSFKVGKGDIDVSSSIVDGEPSKVVIKGKTYQNILPEPSLRNSMKNGKSMQKFNTGYDSVNVVDGVVKSAILRGQTLVNLFKNSEINYEFNHTNSTTSNLYGFLGRNDLIMTLDKSKVYYIIERWQITDRTDKTSTINFQPKVFYADGSEAYFSYNTPFYVGVHTVKRKIQFPKNVTGFHLGVVNIPNNIIKGKSLGCVIMEYQDGMENWDIPYFTGMTSVKMPVLSSVGKNLLDINDSSRQLVGNCSVAITGSTLTVSSIGDGAWQNARYNVKVKPNTKYRLSLSDRTTTGYNVVTIYNGADVIASTGSNLTTKELTITTPSDCYTIAVRFYCSDGTSRTGTSSTYTNIQLEESSTTTTYEPYKSNILSLSEEVVLRSLPNGVRDTYNVVTKEYVKRIGETVITGGMSFNTAFDTETHATYSKSFSAKGGDNLYCDKFPVRSPYNTDSIEGITINSAGNQLALRMSKSRFANSDWNTYLTNNPVTIQYEMLEPVVKTVDLSSFGNWNKVVLNGSENWALANPTDSSYRFYLLHNGVSPSTVSNGKIICNDIPVVDLGNVKDELINIGNAWGINIQLSKDKLSSFSVSEFKQYLSQNPITVWYQTATSQANSIKEMLSFANGHIQLASGVENSLIPSVDYEVPTSNSYHLDLTKTSTKYTMKNMNGTFTVDGTQYNASANGTFTTPSTMTNKLMVTSAIQSNAMLLEGDVTTKTIPYFKGIKSAFEDKDKIEVLSTGKNLYPYKDHVFVPEYTGWYFINGDRQTCWSEQVHENCGQGAWFYLQGGSYCIEAVNNDNAQSFQIVGKNEKLYSSGRVIPSGWYTLRINVKNANVKVEITNVKVVKEVDSSYEPYKSNIAKIPLLSPLRSLPNGVYDELIIDRMKKKAILIQRVGYVKFDNMDKFAFGDDGNNHYLYLSTDRDIYFANRKQLSTAPAIFSHFPYYADGNLGRKDRGDYAAGSNIVFCWCMPTKRDKKERISHLRNLAKQDGVVVQYQLETPVITEIDLENFPLVYKDGHVFLNSEIAPVVEINYNVNQTQQIQANNETLQRHELDILDLDNLIVSFVNAEYNLRLLKFDMELSMMALAE